MQCEQRAAVAFDGVLVDWDREPAPRCVSLVLFICLPLYVYVCVTVWLCTDV